MRRVDWLPKAAFDVTMARTFADPDSPLYWDTIGGCVVTPPCGHVMTHESGTRGHAQGARRSAANSMHWGRWDQNWCRGGTRPMPNGRGRAPTLMSMPGPGVEEVFMPGRGPVLPDDWEELKWRTFVPPAIGDALDRGSSRPRRRRGERSASAALLEAAAASCPSESESGSESTVALQRLAKTHTGLMKRLIRYPMPASWVRRVGPPTLPGVPYTFDAQISDCLRMLASEDDRHRCCMFRAYYLPRDLRAELAFALSMAEGRAGRTGFEALDDEWTDRRTCLRILKRAASDEFANNPPGWLEWD